MNWKCISCSNDIPRPATDPFRCPSCLERAAAQRVAASLTHFAPDYTDKSRVVQTACGRFIDRRHSTGHPTCPTCIKYREDYDGMVL